MSDDIKVTDGTILETLNGKVDLDGGNFAGSGLEAIVKKNGGGGGLEIGDIGIAPLGIDETKGKRRYLNGQLIIQEQYVQFTDKVKSAVALYPSLACSESEWQTTATMTVGGQVGKFVVDNDAGTIRLPKIIMPIQGLTDLSKLGEIVEAGLPNITGTFAPSEADNGGVEKFGSGSNKVTTGAFSLINTSSSSVARETDNKWNGGILSFDASHSNPIYGNSDTVQQEQIQYPYFIQVATGAETEDNIINEIELNNPYSFGDSKYSPVALNNLSWLKSEGQYNPKAVYPAYYDWALTNFNNGVEGFALSTGEYTDYDVVINPAEETFRLPLLDGSEDLPSNRYEDLTLNASGSTYIAPANGWYYLNKRTGTSNAYISISSQSSYLQDAKNSNSASLTVVKEITRGNVATISYSATGDTQAFRFIYAQGNGSLYFYVGETVQNANLINAGRIEEIKANKTDVDGQWVQKQLVLITKDATTSEMIFDLSSYLPNDGYIYNVLVEAICYTGTTSGNYITAYIASDLTYGVCISRAMTRTSSSLQAGGNAWIPVGIGRTFTLNGSTDATFKGSRTVVLQGYRRMGTNV